MKTKTAVIIGVLSLIALVLAVVTFLARYSPINAGYGSVIAGISLSAVTPFLIPILTIGLFLGVACYTSIKNREKPLSEEYIALGKELKNQVATDLDGNAVSSDQSITRGLVPKDCKRDDLEISM